MNNLINIDNICVITECNNKTFQHTRIAVSTFINSNEWFDGTVVILTLESDPISEFNTDKLNLVYDDIVYVKIPDSDILELIEKVNKRKNWEDIMDYLKIFSFKIKSKGSIYISNKTVVLSQLSNIITDDEISMATSSESFPNAGTNLNTNLMYIPECNISDDLYSDLYNELRASVLNGTDSYLTEFISNRFKVNKLNGNISVNSSIFPNNKYGNFVRYSKSISAIHIPRSILKNPKYTKVQIYFNQLVHKHNNVINQSGAVNRLIKRKSKKAKLRVNKITDLTKYDATFCILTTTYNRKKCIEELTRSIKHISLDTKIVVIDDCSNEEINTSNIDTYLKLSENNGKYNWWKTVNLLWDKALEYNCKYYIMLPDDALPNANMLTDAIKLWESIDDTSKIAMQLSNNNRERNWTNFYRVDYNDKIYKTQTTEFSFMCTREFISYIIPPISKGRWKKNKTLGSGVGERLNRYWVKNNKTIYGVKSSLIHSNCLCPDSVMNYEERNKNPWILK